MVYREVAEARSNYKKPYLWWFRNPACGDSTGSNRIEKDWVGVPPGLVRGMGDERWCDLVCVKGLISFSRMVSMVLVLHSRNLILGIKCFTISILLTVSYHAAVYCLDFCIYPISKHWLRNTVLFSKYICSKNELWYFRKFASLLSF